VPVKADDDVPSRLALRDRWRRPTDRQIAPELGSTDFFRYGSVTVTRYDESTIA
jgi:hypothetical protein